MTTRTPRERQRLVFASALLKRYMRGFRFVSTKPEDTRIEGVIRPKGSSRRYKGRVVLLPGYPSCKPELSVIDPLPLVMHDGTTDIASLGSSHAYHTRRNGPDGSVKICHSRDWDASQTCIRVLTKLALWLHAYEEHLRCGQTIDTILHRWAREDK